MATAEPGGDPTKIKNTTPKPKPSGDRPNTYTPKPIIKPQLFLHGDG
jgi:hypothetical protein